MPRRFIARAARKHQTDAAASAAAAATTARQKRDRRVLDEEAGAAHPAGAAPYRPPSSTSPPPVYDASTRRDLARLRAWNRRHPSNADDDALQPPSPTPPPPCPTMDHDQEPDCEGSSAAAAAAAAAAATAEPAPCIEHLLEFVPLRPPPRELCEASAAAAAAEEEDDDEETAIADPEAAAGQQMVLGRLRGGDDTAAQLLPECVVCHLPNYEEAELFYNNNNTAASSSMACPSLSLPVPAAAFWTAAAPDYSGGIDEWKRAPACPRVVAATTAIGPASRDKRRPMARAALDIDTRLVRYLNNGEYNDDDGGGGQRMLTAKTLKASVDPIYRRLYADLDVLRYLSGASLDHVMVKRGGLRWQGYKAGALRPRGGGGKLATETLSRAIMAAVATLPPGVPRLTPQERDSRKAAWVQECKAFRRQRHEDWFRQKQYIERVKVARTLVREHWCAFLYSVYPSFINA